VETASWNDCQEFIKKLNAKGGGGKFSLPSEAQWEYACRSGSKTKYYFGDDELQLGEYAWYEANSDRTTHPVGEKKPNAWGLYDMYGNVFEWCQDWWRRDYKESPVDDPTGPTGGSLRVDRGGAWHSPAWFCRSAHRYCGDVLGSLDLGLRVCYVPEEQIGLPVQSTTRMHPLAHRSSASSSFASSSESNDSPDQASAIVEITKLGGEVIVDEKSPEKPVIRVHLPVVTDAGLANLKGLTHIHTLTLGPDKPAIRAHLPVVTDAGLEHLERLTNLQWLTVVETKVTQAELEHLRELTADNGLANLKHLTELQTLDLRQTKVTDAGLVNLQGLTHLTLLDLADTQVTDAGLAHITNLTELRSLNLAGTQVTDAGLAHLKGLKRLVLMNLQGTKVTDAGLTHLEGLTRLRGLYLSRAKVTDAGVEKLQQALPNCKIMHVASGGASEPNSNQAKAIAYVQQPQEGEQHPQNRYTAMKAIAGVVVDEADRPVSDAHVWFDPYPGNEKTTAHTRSDKKGRFVLEVTWHEGMFSAVWATMWAFAPGHSLSAASAREALAAGRGGPKVRIVLRAQLAPDGACLAGASVAPNYHSLSTGPTVLVPKEVRQAVAATTGPDGRVRLPGLPEHGSFVLVTSKYGSTEVTLPSFNSYEPVEPKTTIRLRPAGRVEGRLIADDSKLVRGVRISLLTGEPRPPIAAFSHGFGRAEVVSDKDGRFVVPTIAEGRLCLRVRIDEQLPYRAIVPEGLTVGNPAPTRVEIRIVPAVRIQGQVHEKESGRPVAGITLFVLYVKGRISLASEGQSPVFAPHETATSDKQGKFTTFVLPGDVSLHLLPYPDGWSPLPEASLEPYSVPAGVAHFNLPPVEVVRSQRTEK
jgi:hypothetical protein